MNRQCSRPACASPAAATLTYNHARRGVWLSDLHPEREPHGYDLCARHADSVSVPCGWQLDDGRTGRVSFLADRLAG